MLHALMLVLNAILHAYILVKKSDEGNGQGD